MLSAVAAVVALAAPSLAITCWKCASHNADWGCLDPFDYQPFVQVNCDYEGWVRDRKPVFCEKRTDIVDGVYVTTRGCSQEDWSDVKGYQDVRDGHVPCIRRGRKETCLCSSDSCNQAPGLQGGSPLLLGLLLLVGLLAAPSCSS